MGLVTVSSNPDESDSIPAVHDVLVDPEIARELGFWGDVGSCSPSAIPSRSSSGDWLHCRAPLIAALRNSDGMSFSNCGYSLKYSVQTRRAHHCCLAPFFVFR